MGQGSLIGIDFNAKEGGKMGIGVNGFGSLQDKFINNLTQKKPAETGKAKKTYGDVEDTFEHGRSEQVYGAAYDKKLSMVKNTDKAEDPTANLSDGAKKVLDELKEKFGGNTDFFVRNYSSEEEAKELLSATEKEFGVLLTADELEKMAADEEYKNKMMGVIEEGQGKINEFKESLSEEELGGVKSIGFTVSEDGTLKYFAELEKQSEKNAERIEKAKEERKEEAEKLKEKLEDKGEDEEGRFPTINKFVKADSLDEITSALKDFLAEKEEDPAAVDFKL